jgi:hypothetical protein
MSVLMKNPRNKVLPFPAPPQEPSPILVQIGGDRFAIHFQVEDLPPAAPLLLPTLRPKMQLLRSISSIGPALPRRRSQEGVGKKE